MIDFTTIGVTLPNNQTGNVRALCPHCSEHHNNRNRTLSCDTDSGLFQCFRCGWKGRVSCGVAWTDRRMDLSALESKRRKRQYAIDRLLEDSVTLRHRSAQPARTYLSRRMGRILERYPNLRFHPHTRYYNDGEWRASYPCLLGEVKDINSRLVTLHRTYIAEDGHKAPLESPRKLMGVPEGSSCTGAAIRLSAATTELVLAEGIETALALSIMLKKPAWACISAHGLETVLIPDTVKRIYIGADHDRSGVGRRAARRLGERVWRTNRKVYIYTPDDVGEDWADVIRRGGTIDE